MLLAVVTLPRVEGLLCFGKVMMASGILVVRGLAQSSYLTLRRNFLVRLLGMLGLQNYLASSGPSCTVCNSRVVELPRWDGVLYFMTVWWLLTLRMGYGSRAACCHRWRRRFPTFSKYAGTYEPPPLVRPLWLTL